MKLFELKGNLIFYAKDIDDAIRKVGKYFTDLAIDSETESIGIPPSHIKIEIKEASHDYPEIDE